MLKNLVTLVTGGASGLGRATVERFAANGAKIILCDLNKTEGEKIAKAHENVLFVSTDITSESDVQNALKIAADSYGGLNVVVNCAGIAIGEKVYDAGRKKLHSIEDFSRVLMVNTVGTFNVLRLSAKLLSANEPNENGERGIIINTASIAAYDGQIGQAAYSASKAAIVGMTLPAARELCAFGIRVMTIAPGLFETPLLMSLPLKVRHTLTEHIPFPQRLGKPDEFAHLVQTIVENPMLNAETIRLDGALRLP